MGQRRKRQRIICNFQETAGDILTAVSLHVQRKKMMWFFEKMEIFLLTWYNIRVVENDLKGRRYKCLNFVQTVEKK